MDYTHWLVIISAVITAAGGIAYIRDTLRGKTNPNRMSWSMWALAPLVGTAAAIASGADIWPTIRIFLAGFLPLIVFIASFFNRESYWKLTTFDFMCGLLSLLGIVVWMVLQSPHLAILFAAIGDGFAALPTLRKAWLYPETETGITYIAGLLSVLIIMPSIPVWNIENAAFQVYLLIVNTLLVLFIYRKRILLRIQ